MEQYLIAHSKRALHLYKCNALFFGLLDYNVYLVKYLKCEKLFILGNAVTNARDDAKTLNIVSHLDAIIIHEIHLALQTLNMRATLCPATLFSIGQYLSVV